MKEASKFMVDGMIHPKGDDLLQEFLLVLFGKF